MKKIFLSLIAILAFASADAQEVAEYDTDSTAYYNALYNPNDYSQTPTKLPQRRLQNRNNLHTNINMGTGFGNMGSYQYIKPTISYAATDRLSLTLGMGLLLSNFKTPTLDYGSSDFSYQNMRGVTNYYSATASYQLSQKCEIYGGIVYANSQYNGETMSTRSVRDRYTAIFGANFNITPGFSIGVEVRQSKNMSPYYMPGTIVNPMDPMGF